MRCRSPCFQRGHVLLYGEYERDTHREKAAILAVRSKLLCNILSLTFAMVGLFVAMVASLLGGVPGRTAGGKGSRTRGKQSVGRSTRWFRVGGLRDEKNERQGEYRRAVEVCVQEYLY